MKGAGALACRLGDAYRATAGSEICRRAAASGAVGDADRL
jgi:hypothetical protein